MKWITREKIKVDRVACPWLIRNFVDSEAEFVFLPRETEWEKMDNVRAADSRPTNPHPAGEGLRWIAGGFGTLGLSDHEILEREFVVYDALYAECKRRMELRLSLK